MPTEIFAAFTCQADSEKAGQELAASLCHKMNPEEANAIIVFASPVYDYQVLLSSLKAACPNGCIVGCSSAGEFMDSCNGVDGASAMAIQSTEMSFKIGFADDLSGGSRAAAAQVVSTFQGLERQDFAHRAALVLCDALSSSTEELMEELTAATGGTYKFFGGGAGDNARFATTHVFNGTAATTNAVVALEILSKRPIGIGVAHGWVPSSGAMRVTQADGTRLVSLNALPAVEAFEEHAAATGQTFNREDPMPFFLHNVIGIESFDGYKLRVPLSIDEEGAILCASDVPQGARVYIMKSGSGSAAQAAADAVSRALEQTAPAQPKGALFFDCVATRLRLGSEFEQELASLKKSLGADVPYVGCNTYGQIARAENQFNGFHNCTAVVCTFPE